MEEQARLSKLEFGSDDRQWSTDGWPAFLLDGARCCHASLVIENDKGKQRLVVMGGQMMIGSTISKSVLVMDLTRNKKEWIEGPSLVEARDELPAAKCNGGLYVIGGHDGKGRLASIERIDVGNLLNFNNNNNNKPATQGWTTLTNCRLSTARFGCAAAAVLDRYIVVAGGHDHWGSLCSVEIIDTFDHSVAAGRAMTEARYRTTMGFIGNRIYVVGGDDESELLDTVEYWEFQNDMAANDEESNVAAVFGSPLSWCWKMDKSLTLFHARNLHALVPLGPCWIVVGGVGQNNRGFNSVEVLDKQRQIVWSLPDMTVARAGCTVAVLPGEVTVIGGRFINSIESLPLLSRRQQSMICANDSKMQ